MNFIKRYFERRRARFIVKEQELARQKVVGMKQRKDLLRERKLIVDRQELEKQKMLGAVDKVDALLRESGEVVDRGFPEPFYTAVHQERLYETYDSIDVAMAYGAADLFTKHYGTWAVKAEMCRRLKPIKISWRRYYAGEFGIIPDEKTNFMHDREATNVETFYIRCIAKGELLGNLFATRWTHKDMEIMWISQMVVQRCWRNKKIATHMLEALKLMYSENAKKSQVVGILAVHPAAIRACYRVFGAHKPNGKSCVDMSRLDETFLRYYAKQVMGSCPVNYVRQAGNNLIGNCFVDASEAVPANENQCCADTDFFMDHSLQRYTIMPKIKGWPCALTIPEGHEFLALFKVGSFDK